MAVCFIETHFHMQRKIKFEITNGKSSLFYFLVCEFPAHIESMVFRHFPWNGNPHIRPTPCYYVISYLRKKQTSAELVCERKKKENVQYIL